MHQIKNLRQSQKLEREWDASVPKYPITYRRFTDIQPPKRHPQPDPREIATVSSVSDFMTQSVPNILGIESNGNKKALDTLQHISNVLGFKFHAGADKNLELVVVKAIMKREDLLMQMYHSCTEDPTGNDKVLDLLMQLRESTVGVLEAISQWRESVPGYDPTSPPPYCWQNENYIMKMVNDVDFLSQNRSLVMSLGLLPSKMLLNPLMLSNTLEENTHIVDPRERAVMDTKGERSGMVFEERFRLRKMERVLLLEMELTMASDDASPSPTHQVLQAWGSGSIKSNSTSLPSAHRNSKSAKRQPTDMMTWYANASTQSKAIASADLGRVQTDRASTHRLDMPSKKEETSLSKIRYVHFNPSLTEPRPITDLMSSNMPQTAVSIRGLKSLKAKNGKSSRSDSELLKSNQPSSASVSAPLIAEESKYRLMERMGMKKSLQQLEIDNMEDSYFYKPRDEKKVDPNFRFPSDDKKIYMWSPNREIYNIVHLPGCPAGGRVDSPLATTGDGLTVEKETGSAHNENDSELECSDSSGGGFGDLDSDLDAPSSELATDSQVLEAQDVLSRPRRGFNGVDLVACLSMTGPPKRLQLAAACCIIALNQGAEVQNNHSSTVTAISLTFTHRTHLFSFIIFRLRMMCPGKCF